MRSLLSSSSLLAGLLAVSMGCGPNPPAPVAVMGLVLDPSGAYRPKEVQLKTVTDIVGLQGSAASLVGDARIVLDPKDPLLQGNLDQISDVQLAAALVKSAGTHPVAHYVDKDGVLWPADFHTWNMVTTYYNFEKAVEYFQGAFDGRPTDELLGSKVYYFPAMILDGSTREMKDNALFFSPLQGFAVLPFDQLQGVPLSINPWVIGHEFSHRVFNRKVYDGRAIPPVFTQWTTLLGQSPGLNLLKSIDEGFADFHAYGVSCLSEFGCNLRALAPSVPNEVEARDFSKPDKCLSADLRNSLTTSKLDTFVGTGLQYKVGTVFAAALYQAGSKAEKIPELQKALIRTYNDPASATPGLEQLISLTLDNPQAFSVARVANAVLQHIADPDLRRLTCNEFLDRLALSCPSFPCTQLPDCPASSASNHQCPVLP